MRAADDLQVHELRAVTAPVPGRTLNGPPGPPRRGAHSWACCRPRLRTDSGSIGPWIRDAADPAHGEARSLGESRCSSPVAPKSYIFAHRPDRTALGLLEAQAGWVSTHDAVKLRRALLAHHIRAGRPETPLVGPGRVTGLPGYGRRHCWFDPPLQSHRTSCVPLVVLLWKSSRHLPVAGLTSCPLTACHCCSRSSGRPSSHWRP
jgi:hypothetical protein